ncbi:MAG: phosphomethylpyrimidine synthase ThiC, partial [Hyphomicrobiales bacterium]|nr:phosphomethylpyrimidine synthase ThiC [Hyphomicrobiales bacterium]
MNVHAKRPLTPETVTTGPIQGSRKVYAEVAPSIRVPFREIALSKESGEPPVRVYDASGPYTDSA